MLIFALEKEQQPESSPGTKTFAVLWLKKLDMDYLEINKKLWNSRTEIHYASEFYDVDGFLKGKDPLNPIEIELLGDIAGKKVLHLQCHFGLDTLALSRRGAEVTGVDFSESAIAKARRLNKAAGTNATFIHCDIYSLMNSLDGEFDLVFTSYGVIGWLPDLIRWAEVIAHFLKPGGKLVLVEFHPVVWMFSNDFQKIAFNYSGTEPIIEDLEGTYTDPKANIKETSICWNHGISDVLEPLIANGLQITGFKEYDYSPYDCFENTVSMDKGKYQIKGLEGKIPMVYALDAMKTRRTGMQ